MKVTYSGNVSFTGLKDQSAAVFGGTSYETPAETKITFPESVSAGYTFQPNEKWSFTAEGQWTNWSRVKELAVTYFHVVFVSS